VWVDLNHICAQVWPWPIKAKVTELLKLRKSHFPRSFSPPLSRGPQNWWLMMISMGPGLQLVWARFSNFLLGKLSREFRLCRMLRFHVIQMATFLYCARRLQLHVDPIVHADMTLIWSKVKVKVTGLLKFRKLHFSRSISSAVLAWSSKMMVDSDGMGPGLLWPSEVPKIALLYVYLLRYFGMALPSDGWLR